MTFPQMTALSSTIPTATVASIFPLSTTTSSAITSIPTTSTSILTTSTAAAATAPKPVRTFRDFERLLTKWQQDFDVKHRMVYDDLAQSIRQRDIDLSQYRETLQLLQRGVNRMTTHQSHLQEDLKLLDTHEKELESNISKLESDIQLLPPIYSSYQQLTPFGSSTTLTERMKNFEMLENMDGLVKRSIKDLNDIVEKMDEDENIDDMNDDIEQHTNVTATTDSSTKSTVGNNEQSVKQVTKTLNSCFKMLNFIEKNVQDIELKVSQTNRLMS
ncbi:unnamed protein product [Didymodactylos carnosus]|uniref:Nucleoporin NSP1-like C-terminal domain-containing protein n=1 Tax=Didymodactylos carnosus TaxID=1234261 RepID=A0A813V0Y9_9BILA|nr:unnamed protein product [Didymodactylos carnosus]CAF0838127.1 unnamed protein product [Didymodactylos carnosus]CAF3518635.1 unnamed protein product [Didymodactylos carnosus]CAF3625392.1 unnamed protein product [Didymodactylos carnosus]